MGKRIYSVVFVGVSVAAQQDLFEITPADDKPLAIIGLTLDNVGIAADAGDAQEEILQVNIIRGFTTSGSAGSAPTPTPLSTNDTASGFTSEVNNTTVANTGTSATLWAGGWNTRIGLREFWAEEYWFYVGQPSTTAVVRLASTPSDAFLASGTLWVAELL